VSFHPPTSISQRPSHQSSASLLLVSDRAVEVGKVKPVRDDALERYVSVADHSAVRPSIVPASPHPGHRSIAAWPSQHQRDRVAHNPIHRSILDPPHDPRGRYTRQLHHPRSVEWDQPSNWPVMQHDRLSRLIEGVHRGKWRSCFTGRGLRAHGVIVGSALGDEAGSLRSNDWATHAMPSAVILPVRATRVPYRTVKHGPQRTTTVTVTTPMTSPRPLYQLERIPRTCLIRRRSQRLARISTSC
jgi:hypothetical protein